MPQNGSHVIRTPEGTEGTVDSYTRLKAVEIFEQEEQSESLKDRASGAVSGNVSGAFGECLSLILWYQKIKYTQRVPHLYPALSSKSFKSYLQSQNVWIVKSFHQIFVLPL